MEGREARGGRVRGGMEGRKGKRWDGEERIAERME